MEEVASVIENTNDKSMKSHPSVDVVITKLPSVPTSQPLAILDLETCLMLPRGAFQKGHARWSINIDPNREIGPVCLEKSHVARVRGSTCDVRLERLPQRYIKDGMMAGLGLQGAGAPVRKLSPDGAPCPPGLHTRWTLAVLNEDVLITFLVNI